MAESPQKNLVTRLADVGEEAIQRLGGAPGGDRLVGAVNTLRNRMDEMQKRLRGLDEVEERLASVEQRLDALEATVASSSGGALSSSRKKSQSSTAGGD
jgi:DNA repair ATPase RecN